MSTNENKNFLKPTIFSYLILRYIFHTTFFRKIDRHGYVKVWIIRANRYKNRVRTYHLEVHGTCCWKIRSSHGQTETLYPGDDKTSPISYIRNIRTLEC